MKFLGESVEKASTHVVKDLGLNEGVGGLIVLDSEGNCKLQTYSHKNNNLTLSVVALPLNCGGMYRGAIKEDGCPKVAIFSDDELE